MPTAPQQLTYGQKTLAKQLQDIAAENGCISPAIVAAAEGASRIRVFLREFGSWTNAARAAGVIYNPNAKPKPPENVYSAADWREMTDRDILRALQGLCEATGGLSTGIISTYASRGVCPSLILLRKRFKFNRVEDFCNQYNLNYSGMRARKPRR